MKLRFTETADKDYAGLPVAIRKAFAKQLRFLLANLRHPLTARQEIQRGLGCVAGQGDEGLAILLQDRAG